MKRRRIVGFYLAAAGAVVSGLAAFYCGMGYAMTGSFAVAHDATPEQVRRVALFWGISALALVCLTVCLVFVAVRLSSLRTDE